MNNQRPVTIFDPIHDSVREVLEKRQAVFVFHRMPLTSFRLSEYSTTRYCTIFAGTWNLNGRVCCYVVSYKNLLTSGSLLPSRYFLGCFLERVSAIAKFLFHCQPHCRSRHQRVCYMTPLLFRRRLTLAAPTCL
jgi:hypothetical protein